MTEMQYDVEKNPLGNLTKKQVQRGYEALKELEAAINRGAGHSVLAELTSKFYTYGSYSLGLE